MSDNVLSVQIQYPDDMDIDEAIKAFNEFIFFGRSKLAGATKDETAIRYLKVEVLKVEPRP
jgi:hypothetical protein